MEKEEKVAQEAASAAEENVDAGAAQDVNVPANGDAGGSDPTAVFYERIRTSRPDGKYDEDNKEYYRTAMRIMDDLDSKGKKLDDMIAKIMSRFNENPDEAAAFLDYLDGMSLPAAIRKNMGDEALTMKEGDDGWDEYKKAGEDRKKSFEESMAYAQMLKDNGAKSDELIAEFAKENNMSEEETKEFTDAVMNLVIEFSKGNVSKDVLAGFKRSRDYDKDIASAREQGVIDGKNESIALEKKRMQGSGLPNAAAGGATSEEDAPKEKNNTAEWLSKMKQLR